MVIAIFGPTAVGKTDIAIELAELLRGGGERPVAVSADAMQVYEGMDGLTAKPTVAQLERLEHRLISFVPIDATYSAGQFAQDAHREIDSLLAAGCLPIVVGGTGLYLRAALADMSFDRRAGDRGELWSAETRHPTLLGGVTVDRRNLYEAIDRRVERIVAGCAVEDVREAIDRGASKTARKALGFAEIEVFLRGEVDEPEMIARIKQRTRNYARRQLTWMRKLPADATLDRTGQSAESVARRLAALALAASP